MSQIQTIMDRIHTLEDVCRETGRDYQELQNYIAPLTRDEQNHVLCKEIAKAYNQGWVPDFTNSELKYGPWMVYKAGSGFSYFVYGCGRTATSVGARLCFKHWEHVKDATSKFPEVYNGYYSY